MTTNTVQKQTKDYIHRVGRTARAGRSGTCITLYTRYTECLLEQIEQKAKIKIKRIGAPQKKDIIEASIRDTYRNLMSIDDSMIKLFMDNAKKLIEEFDIKRVAFPKDTTAYRFEKQIIIPNDTIVDSRTMPEFHTDGTYQLIKTPDGDNAWLVSNAT